MEPAETHYYQPAWTLVGANTYNFDATARPMSSLIPDRELTGSKNMLINLTLKRIRSEPRTVALIPMTIWLFVRV